MGAIEKRARELLVAACPSLKEEYFENSPHMTAINLHEALVAVRSALTPPEGYVLVPVEMTKEIGEALDESIKHRYSSESAWDLAIHAVRQEVL